MFNLIIKRKWKRVGLFDYEGHSLLKDSNNNLYFAKDAEKFLSANPGLQSRQQILRYISNTAFLPGSKTVQFYFYSEEEKQTKNLLENHFPKTDEKLTSIVSLCEGADTSDIEKFYLIDEVLEFCELKQLDSDLSSGLGFPGTGYGLIRCIEREPLGGIKIYLQIVHSYMEGYSVEHQLISHEMFNLISSGAIDKYFVKND